MVEHRPIAQGVFWASLAIGLSLLGWVLTAAPAPTAIPDGWPGPLRAILEPVATNAILPLALTLTTFVGLIAWHRWRRYPARPEVGALVTGVITLLLGSVAYATCRGDATWASVLVWVVGLFALQAEPQIIGPEAAEQICRTYPLTFVLARLFGMYTLAFGAVAVFAALFRPALDRVRVRFAVDVDVVAGLRREALPLVDALVADRARRFATPPWPQPRWGERLGRLASRLFGGIVVIHPSGQDPLAEDARARGAVVYVADPADPVALRRTMLSPWGGVALRRLFAVSPTHSRNIAVVERGEAILTGAARTPATTPRLVALFSDAREARDWRLTRVGSRACFVDSLNADELLARGIADRLETFRCTHLIIAGDSSLTMSQLEELGRRHTFRHELRSVASDLPDPSLREVVLVSEFAQDIRSEWAQHRPPGHPGEASFTVHAREDQRWRDTVAEVVQPGRRVALLVTEPPSRQVSERAMRLNRSHPDLLVIRPSVHLEGVGQLPDGVGGIPDRIVRYGPAITDAGRVPEDAWVVLARQQAEHYRLGSPGVTVSRRPWPTAGEDAPHGEFLPEFFREKNLRQQRHILERLVERGYTFRVVTEGDERQTVAPRDVLDIARLEHERWCEQRLERGWRYPPNVPPEPAKPSDGLKLQWEADRLNPSLVHWDSGQPLPERIHWLHGRTEEPVNIDSLQNWNVGIVEQMLQRLWHWGVAPALDSYQRIGTVRARRLAEAREWVTSRGTPMTSQAGDWWVWDSGLDEREDDGRGVSATAFEATHRPTDVPGVYERTARVRAGQLTARVPVTTEEGDDVGEPGDWRVIDDRGAMWVVDDVRFGATYAALAQQSPPDAKKRRARGSRLTRKSGRRRTP